VLAGALCGSEKLVSEVRKYHHVLGGVVDSHAAYLVLRGMKTLKLRVAHQNETALRLARVLEKHPKISVVHYPGLESHPEHHIAKKQMSGYGGVLSFEVDADLMTTAKFIDGTLVLKKDPSLFFAAGSGPEAGGRQTFIVMGNDPAMAKPPDTTSNRCVHGSREAR
jgi:cystathionine gamma-synthase